MRNAFAAEITELAAKDDRIVLLMGDIGNRLFDPFKEQFPSRFFNCGVAEANMTGMAAGMAYDDIIDPRELRNAILDGLRMARDRLARGPGGSRQAPAG